MQVQKNELLASLPERLENIIHWANTIHKEYDEAVKLRKTTAHDLRMPEEKSSPLGNEFNHIIAVVFYNVPVNGEPASTFFIDMNGLHFYEYPFDLKTREYGTQVHIVYRSEHENLAWVESRCFHKGSTYIQERYIIGSEKPIHIPGQGFEDIYHG